MLEAFEHEATRPGMLWTTVHVDVDVVRQERPQRVVQVDYQIRVATEDAALAQIASHELEAHSPVFASLAAATEHTGRVLSLRPTEGHDAT